MHRQPAVAGLFYPNNSRELKATVESYLSADVKGERPKAMILPHAGYIYSGAIAANGYRLIKPFAQEIKRVVLLGPSHRVAFFGLAASSAQFFTTPLGEVTVDTQTVGALINQGLAKYLDEAHQMEHCLEVHLPFLQLTLGDFAIVPIVVGQCAIEEVSDLLNAVWGGDETLIVVSSDLSHYLPYEAAQKIDKHTAQAIIDYNVPAIGHHEACGATPIRGLLQSAQRHHLKPSCLRLCNSGDTGGKKDSVVGYGAFTFH